MAITKWFVGMNRCISFFPSFTLSLSLFSPWLLLFRVFSFAEFTQLNARCFGLVVIAVTKPHSTQIETMAHVNN